MGDQPDASESPTPYGLPVPDVGLLARRANEYIAVWEQAASRLVHSEYHSEDLIDDWFTFWGKWVRDSTAAAAFTWKAFVAQSGTTTEGDRDAR